MTADTPSPSPTPTPPATTVAPTPPDAQPARPVLNAGERRVLGVLVEKGKTTPDAYPLSLNAMVNGCNQKTNRDPLTSFSEDEVEDFLASAQKKGLVLKVTGGRVIRWRHTLYDTWKVSNVELAILTELLLRGPQTEGELRTRASRMEDIPDLDFLRSQLTSLADRKLVVFVTPLGRRGTTVTHGFHDPRELEQIQKSAGAASLAEESTHASRPTEAPARPVFRETPAGAGVSEAEFRALQQEVATLKTAVTELQAKVAALTANPPMSQAQPQSM